jgi:DNA topoisomerase I
MPKQPESICSGGSGSDPEYTKAHGSLGLTTLQDRHVRVRGSKLQFHFRRKSGQEHGVEMEERRLARVVKQCRPAWLRTISVCHRRGPARSDWLRRRQRLPPGNHGQDFTAKDFRTWAVLVVEALRECHRCESETQAKKNVIEAVKSVADRLGSSRNLP